MKMSAATALSCLVFLSVVVKCNHHEPQAVISERAESTTTWIGLAPERNIFDQVNRYEPLLAYLSEKTATRIQPKLLTTYERLVDDFDASGLDGAFFGSMGYATAHAKLGVNVIARPEDLDGVSSYHGVLFVRKDSGIRTVGDMKGKRFVFAAKGTTAGHLFPLAVFKEAGIGSYDDYFKETYFAGTHSDAIQDVLEGEGDIGVAKSTEYDRLAAHDARVNQELMVLERSPEVPENGLALRRAIDPALRDRLKAALLSMHEDPKGRDVLIHFGARRFIETTDADYDVVYEYAKNNGPDLAIDNPVRLR